MGNLSAKRAYENPRDPQLRRGVASVSAADQEDKMELRMDRMEKALLTAIEKSEPPSPTLRQITEQKGQSSNYDPPVDMDGMAQVNAARYWNPNGSWNPGKPRDARWRDHPNFRWGEGNQNQNQNQGQYAPLQIRISIGILQPRSSIQLGRKEPTATEPVPKPKPTKSKLKFCIYTTPPEKQPEPSTLAKP